MVVGASLAAEPDGGGVGVLPPTNPPTLVDVTVPPTPPTMFPLPPSKPKSIKFFTNALGSGTRALCGGTGGGTTDAGGIETGVGTGGLRMGTKFDIMR